MIRLRCSCNHKIEAQDWMAGKKMKCPACNHWVDVPGEDPLPPPSPDLGAAARAAATAKPPRPGGEAGPESPPVPREPRPAPVEQDTDGLPAESPPYVFINDSEPGPPERTGRLARGQGAKPARIQDEDSQAASGMAIGALCFSIAGISLMCFPFVGFLGTVGWLLASSDLSRTRRLGQRHGRGIATAAYIVGIIPTLVALAWVVLFLWAGTRPASRSGGCCPHVYAHDGGEWILDADPLSGAWLRAGEREDLDRMESLVARNGLYRIRVANDLDELDHIDAVHLIAVDHAPDEEALPTPSGTIARVRGAIAPRAALDMQGRDLRSTVREADGDSYRGHARDFAAEPEREPRERIRLTFPAAPPGARPHLLLRTRCTAFAAEAFGQYMDILGGANIALLAWAADCPDYPLPQRLADDFRRLGLVLDVRAGDGTGPATEILPIGPAAWREIAVPLAPAEGGPLSVTVELAPLLWEIDRIRLAWEANGAPAAVHRLAAGSARHGNGTDVLAALAADDEAVATLEPGARIDLEFPVPAPPPGTARTVILAIRGDYIPYMRNPTWFNPVAVHRHQNGGDSLPRYALRVARARGETGAPEAGR